MKVHAVKEQIQICMYSSTDSSKLKYIRMFSDFKSNTARDLYRKHYATNQTNVSTKQQTGPFETNYSSPLTNHAAGRPNRDTHLADKRPATSFQLDFGSTSKASFQNHLNHLNDRFQPKYCRGTNNLLLKKTIRNRLISI